MWAIIFFIINFFEIEILEPPIEPRGINPDLTSNPVYGNVKLANINRTGAQNDGFMSDRVYQIESKIFGYIFANTENY